MSTPTPSVSATCRKFPSAAKWRLRRRSYSERLSVEDGQMLLSPPTARAHTCEHLQTLPRWRATPPPSTCRGRRPRSMPVMSRRCLADTRGRRGGRGRGRGEAEEGDKQGAARLLQNAPFLKIRLVIRREASIPTPPPTRWLRPPIRDPLCISSRCSSPETPPHAAPSEGPVSPCCCHRFQRTRRLPAAGDNYDILTEG